MNCKWCEHPKKVHSVYRDTCLINECNCKRCGGLTLEQLCDADGGLRG